MIRWDEQFYGVVQMAMCGIHPLKIMAAPRSLLR